ncbi:UNVERIFIED_CONTAM: hypothetical protein PYX00_008250 [Menopon gallinae]|uniref:Golgi apparatus membrane protein TVP23 homolog n=2 Tax=Menopon gallinae TaxID=328185 RepID=A0AAW2HM74_9NEOP
MTFVTETQLRVDQSDCRTFAKQKMASAKVHLLEDGDDTPQFGEEEDENSDKLKHPVVTFFHLAFRVSALVVYILCGWFSNSFITSFVTVVLLLSMDFWTVKNITGRLMVGLRWWNYVDDSGKSHWVYEFKKGSNQSRINSSEARIFWLGLVLSQFMWAILFIIALLGFKFKWLLLVSIALVLNGANLYGYVKCKVGSNDSMTSSFSNISSNFVWQQLIKNALGVFHSSERPVSKV